MKLSDESLIKLFKSTGDDDYRAELEERGICVYCFGEGEVEVGQYDDFDRVRCECQILV
jgi:hypothetical protein